MSFHYKGKYIYKFSDDLQSAIFWTKKLLQLDPKHARARGNIPHYQKSMQEQQEKLRADRRGVWFVFSHVNYDALYQLQIVLRE